MSTEILCGAEAIKAALATMPGTPGVYRMKNAQGDILYIGKAKHLPARVSSYISVNQLTGRIMRMVQQVVEVEVTPTASEAEALLLEAALVKKHQPRYNILLKDDKAFPAIHFTGDHAFPRITKHRGAQGKTGHYFGPFPSAGAVNATLALLQKAFLLRPCSDTIFANRTRPCLQYQIKRCTAPCVGYVTEAEYGEQVKLATDFLRGKSQAVQAVLAEKMHAASDAWQFEKAALLRDQIRALSKVQHAGALQAHGLRDADVMAIARQSAASVVQVFLFRAGQHFGYQSYFPSHGEDASDAAILTQFMGQFYQAHLPPTHILTNVTIDDHAVMEDALSLRAETRVSIAQPQRGDKKQLIDHVAQSAAASLQRMLESRASIASFHARMQEIFALPQLPERMEVYDNSHIMGTQCVGAVVVATQNGFEKKHYRTYAIRAEEAKGDDYAMLREVLTRRFSKPPEIMPDLLLIDGGAGQLSAARTVMESLNMLHIPMVAIAKGRDRNAGREWFYVHGMEPFQLPENDGCLHYLQRLRDEVHRFAIGAHRSKRSRAFTASALDDIPGIGASRKRALLAHFGSRAGVAEASLQALTAVPGISKQLAAQIYDYFRR